MVLGEPMMKLESLGPTPTIDLFVEISDEMRELARRAVEYQARTRNMSEAEIQRWATRLAMDVSNLVD